MLQKSFFSKNQLAETAVHVREYPQTHQIKMTQMLIQLSMNALKSKILKNTKLLQSSPGNNLTSYKVTAVV